MLNGHLLSLICDLSSPHHFLFLCFYHCCLTRMFCSFPVFLYGIDFLGIVEVPLTSETLNAASTTLEATSCSSLGRFCCDRCLSFKRVATCS